MTNLSVRSLIVSCFALALTAGAAFAQSLPAGWSTRDVGAVAAAGFATSANEIFTVAGSGADVWGTADEFRFVYRPLTGDGSVITRVGSMDNVNSWVKAGVMMRETLSAGSRHAFMLVSPGKGLAFQRRTATGGVSTHTSGGTGAAPSWVKLTRSGATFTAYKSVDGVTWTKVGAKSISMAATIQVGVAVSSHVDGVLASASFDGTAVVTALAQLQQVTAAETSTSTAETSAISGSLPSGWSSREIGGAGGRAAYSASTFLLEGAGSDIWSYADEFRFAYKSLSGDGDVVAQVATLENVDVWTKAGVMMRETLTGGSRHASMLVSPGKGLAFQRRTSTGNASTHTSGGSGAAPRWVKLTRRGSVFSAYSSRDGATWTLVGKQTITMASTISVGLVVSSHAEGVAATATFEGVSLRSVASSENTTAPADASTSTSSSSTLRVLHWNTHHGRGTDNEYDLDRIATWIAKMNPDVVSLNEIERFVGAHGNEDQPARYAALLKAKTGRHWYYYYRSARNTSTGGGSMILSRYPIDGTSVCYMSSSANAVHASVEVNGRVLNIWSTHLSPGDSSSPRVTQAKALLACARQFSENRMLAGDWNATQQRTEYTMMLDTYVDSWAKAKSAGDAIDYAGNSRDGATHNYRIDYVFYSKGVSALTLEKAQVFDTRGSDGARASDHKPLLTTFTVR